jgi:hypothetical protein
MVRNTWESLVKLMPTYYSYQRVERALCAALEIPSERRPKLAARLKHLQRLGLQAAERPSGARAEYEQEGIDRWLVALVLMRLNIDPTRAVQTVLEQWHWPKGDTKARGKDLAEIVRLARQSPHDDERGIHLYLEVDDLLLRSESTVGIGWLRPLDTRGRGEPRPNWELVFAPGPYGRSLFPLSYILHQLDRALATPREDLP